VADVRDAAAALAALAGAQPDAAEELRKLKVRFPVLLPAFPRRFFVLLRGGV